MVLMRSIFQVPRAMITRVYDLKGSEIHREVLKHESMDPS
jgi:hypothetical protein